MKQIEKEVETHDMGLQALVYGDSLNQTKLAYKIDTGLKTIVTSIQKFRKVVVESTPCELTFTRKKEKQAQMMVVDLLPPMSVENIQLNLNQGMNTKGTWITGCSLLSNCKMVLSCSSTSTVNFISTEGVELVQIGRYRIGSSTNDTVYIKDNNIIAVSSGSGINRCIVIIDIESQKVMTTISMDTYIYGMAVRGRTRYYCAGSKGIKMLNLCDESKSNVINSDMLGVYYVATSEDI